MTTVSVSGRLRRAMSSHPTVGSVAALAGWCAMLAGAVVVLTRAGARLGAPPWPPAAWSGWVDGHDPGLVAFAVLRLGALALAWYLAGATVLGLLARLSRLPALIRAADLVTIPPVRRVLHAALGATLAVAASTAPAGAALGPSPPAVTASSNPPVVPPAPEPAAPGPPAAIPGQPATPDPPVLRRLPDAAPNPSGPADTGTTTEPAALPEPDPPVLRGLPDPAPNPSAPDASDPPVLRRLPDPAPNPSAPAGTGTTGPPTAP
ncbi:MAG: hypothetical protein QOK43_967, partial [Acidimicrobiaceae bacterium]|nr:hypothetical protein [Acidimicrobiaceae bacterium]